MDDVLTRLRSSLKLTDDEEIESKPPMEAWANMELNTDLILIGRILTRKEINREALERTMSKVWSPVHGIQVDKIGDGRFIFIFKHEMDRRRAMEEGPWCFDKNLIVLQKIEAEENPKRVSLDWCDFYVHVLGLPFSKRNRAMANHIGDMIGISKVGTCNDDVRVFGDVLRLRAAVNVNKPLRRIARLRNEKGELVVVNLQYERLPNFCYFCGLMDHISGGCSKQYSLSVEERNGDNPYGEWLKATAPSKATIGLLHSFHSGGDVQSPGGGSSGEGQNLASPSTASLGKEVDLGVHGKGKSVFSQNQGSLQIRENGDFDINDINKSIIPFGGVNARDWDNPNTSMHQSWSHLTNVRISPPNQEINVGNFFSSNSTGLMDGSMGPFQLNGPLFSQFNHGTKITSGISIKPKASRGRPRTTKVEISDSTVMDKNTVKRKRGDSKTSPKRILIKGKKKTSVPMEVDSLEEERPKKQLVIRDSNSTEKFSLTAEAEANGKSGGLALLWQKDLLVSLNNFSVNHIDAFIFDNNLNDTWRFTGFYGNPNETLRHQSWNLLRKLSELSNKAWLCAGDFNAMLSNSEKSGRYLASFKDIQEFSDCLRDTRLNDLGFVGYPFTWSNNRKAPHTTRERLDRACGNNEWMELFPNYRVRHLDALYSDHIPLLIEWRSAIIAQQGGRNRGFKFEAMWLKSEECEQIIRENWHANVSQQTSLDQWSNLEHCKLGLLRWSRVSFGCVRDRIRKLKEKIVKLKKRVLTAETKSEIHDLSRELDELLDKEEVMWRQRAKAHWMREGDKNTKFFHAKASSRRRKNTIAGLCNSEGVWCEREADIEKIVSDYFSDIFTSKDQPTSVMEEVLDAIEPRVSDTLNRILLEEYTVDEVKKALDGMQPLKSPGPDGFPVVFFQRFWSVVGSDVSKWVLALLNRRELPRAGNYTHIVLIPKCDNPRNMTQFRPISLSNVVYKIASKAIVNRLKPHMNSIISDSQSAFVPSRLISDNILIAYEVVHYMKRSTAEHMAIKLDMSKAYDRIEWSFLRGVMSRLGFHSNFIDLVMLCVSTVTYSFVLNGRSFGFLAPERGLRQGDPISPYLFLFCAEALSALIKQEERCGNIAGLAVCKEAPSISHLLFADDTIIFCNANVYSAACVKKILRVYEEASGQMVNYQKSSIVFSKTTTEENINLICSELPMEVVDNHDRYLGLPSTLGKSKREAFANLRDRVCRRLRGWKEKWLSRGGKEILIKAVIQAIPTYAMSCFRLPRYFIEEMEKHMAKFWWENTKGKGIHWAKWQDMCSSKDFGGLGFRDLNAFNTALLAKQVWRLMVSPHSLLGRIYKARYYPLSNILDSSLGSNPSYTWRSICGAIDLLKKGTRWRIGNGDKVQIWGDRWLPRGSTFKPFTPRGQWPSDMKVSSLIDSVTGQWDPHILSQIFVEEDINCILSIPLGSSINEDKLMWHYNRNGLFSVRSAYYIAVQMEKEKDGSNSASSSSSTLSGSWKWLWTLKLPSDEDVLHCLALCTFARQVWALSGVPYLIHWPKDKSVIEWVLWMKQHQDSAQFEYCVVICWAIWNARNKKLFEDMDKSAMDIILFAKKFTSDMRGLSSVVLSPRPLYSSKRSTIRWEAPPRGVVKINFDASLCSIDNGCGLGGLARDFDGRCVGWYSISCKQYFDPVTAEAMAALKALEFARDHDFRRVALEGDSSVIVAAIRGEDDSYTSYGNLINDIKRLATTFEEFHIYHILREGNSAAHEIAKLSAWGPCNFSALPDFIKDIVSSEFSS
ncbi:PREDICTED: uncharacterized protein LOC105967373 [Erythranthe guttata]|uniref:uncharacterized protein LOC105967373 n=1 Tax=Erythranthe guttata TaxID=4155 RepID=UPI00064D8A0C|nr:PREDICTED: uncharacterized protein LOC105967373 [Erythranthe guttata]|eukprot:XP_012847426.1 PREDICTED: uncharacterized protein LOC105967373 [Erythranthe guttata]